MKRVAEPTTHPPTNTHTQPKEKAITRDRLMFIDTIFKRAKL